MSNLDQIGVEVSLIVYSCKYPFMLPFGFGVGVLSLDDKCARYLLF